MLAQTTAPSIASYLMELGEPFGAGFYEDPEAPSLKRIARGIRRQLEHALLPPWSGGPFYPEGTSTLWRTNHSLITFHYSYPLNYNRNAMLELMSSTPDLSGKSILRAIDEELRTYYQGGSAIEPRYRLGGDGYTHSIPNTGRIVREGLHAYAQRVKEKLRVAEAVGNQEAVIFYTALEDVLASIEALHKRVLSLLSNATGPASEGRETLLAALKQVPFSPARNFYEAMVAANFIFYLDGCDSPGRFDQDLFPYYEQDLKAGLIDHDQALALTKEFFKNINTNDGWNMTIGGSTASGAAAYNELTLICLEAAQGKRRPNLALRIRSDMPESLWQAALDTIGTGCGLPALYNEKAYLKALEEAHLHIHYRDLHDYAFGGCTETMIHGRSNVGSLDAGINLVEILLDTLTEHLAGAQTFAELWEEYKADLAKAIAQVTQQVNTDQMLKARFLPQPLRTLLIDDCIDAGREYNAGGARYNWSVINIGGLGNVADSLMAIKELVFEKKEISASDLWQALQSDFKGHELLEKRIAACPKYGNDNPAVDELAAAVAAFVFQQLSLYAPWRGGRFLPGCLMFVTYAQAGQYLMATPDGRRNGTPIADSAGPVQGRDRHGPTAMMRSVARLPHSLAAGTLVVNLRLTKSLFASPEGRSAVKSLVQTYFSLGCMQLQINVVDQTVLRDAIAHPEQYADLIVRVGGYSEYFNRLSPELKLSLLERTEHGGNQ